MTSPFDLTGRTALVTGGTRGIGRAISLQLARSGVAVIANYARDAKSAEELEALSQQEGLRLRTCRADITSETGLQRVEEAVGEQGPNLSILVHAAATGVHRRLEELSTRHFDWTFSLNARAFLTLVTRLLPRLEKGSSVIAISSAGAVRAVPQYTLVGASKGALESLVRHMAVELAPRGIRVNAVSPGTILTDAWKALPESEQRLAEASQRAPLGRLTTSEEVAQAIHFLCSGAASGILGHVLVVDGGYQVLS